MNDNDTENTENTELNLPKPPEPTMIKETFSKNKQQPPKGKSDSNN